PCREAGSAGTAERGPAALRIELGAEDATRLAANTVAIGDTLVMSACSRRLRAQLRERGYRVAATSLASFQRSGGSAFCLTLRLDRPPEQGEVRRAAAAERTPATQSPGASPPPCPANPPVHVT